MPAYNREELIGESLESLLAQTHQNWECIVVDDGSDDNTVAVVEAYSEGDTRIKVYRRPASKKKGASPCRNYGLEKARGDYIQFLDSDDLLKSNKFEVQLDKLENADPLAMATCRWGSFRVASQVKVKTKYNSYRSLEKSQKLFRIFARYDEYFPPFVYLSPREVILKAGWWDESLENNPNDDGEYFSRVIRESSEMIFCDSTEGYYRAGDDDRLSLLNDPQKIRSAIESWKMIEKNLKDLPGGSEYANNGINSIFARIQYSHPEIIKEYEVLYRSCRKPQRWYRKLFNSFKN